MIIRNILLTAIIVNFIALPANGSMKMEERIPMETPVMEKVPQWGYIDKSGNIVIPPYFDYAQPFKNGYAKVTINGKSAVIDKKGNCVPEPKREEHSISSKKKAPVSEEVGDFHEDLAKFKKNEKYGYINKRGEIVIKAEFDSAGTFSEGLADVEIEGKIGFINSKGELKIKSQFFSSASYSQGMFSDGLGLVAFHGTGFINKQGKIAIIPQFSLRTDEVGNFSEGLAHVKIGEKFGYIDKNGQTVIEPKYDWAEPFSEGLARVKEYSKKGLGFIDKKGNYVLEPVYRNVGKKFSEGLVSFQSTDNKWGYMDKKGSQIIKPQFAQAENFKNGIARVESQKDSGYEYLFINKKGNLVIDFKFENPADFYENALNVKDKNGKWGYLDKDGNWFIKPVFEDASPFSQGLAAVKKNGKWGYINKEGNLIIKHKFEAAGLFSDDSAIVLESGKTVIVNKKGETLFTTKLVLVEGFHEGMAKISVGG